MAVTYLAEPTLEIDGKAAPKELMQDILQISVEESLHLPGTFTIVIQNAYFPGQENNDNRKPWQHEKLFAIGKSIKISFTSSTTLSPEFKDAHEGSVLEGEITAMETHFTSGSQAPMIVRGYDVSHRMHRGRYNRSFQNMKDSDIVKKIAKEVGLEIGKVEDSDGPHGYDDPPGYVFQNNQTNMEFLRERAARIGFELFVQDGKLYFRKPAKNDKSLQLKWLKELQSFRVRISSAEQVSGVEVRGWDYSQKKPIVETADSEQVITETENGKGSKTSTKFKKLPKPKLIMVNQPISSSKEAKKMAQAKFDELGGEFVHADGRAQGNATIRPGRVVELKDMGKYSGKYYITDTRHLYHEGVYTTEFSVRGLRGGSLLSLLSSQAAPQPGETLLVGIVTDNKDPKGWGRVKVKFPTLTEEHASHWARVVGAGAANQRGFDCLPEINDEVLVAFEHGDIHRPYVIGGVWNGKDAPPAKVGDSIQDGKVRLRTFKTRTGHQIQCVEEDKGGSKKGVYVETAGGHKIRINDSNKMVEVETSGGHKLTLSDSGKSISMSSTGSIEIKAATTIDIRASGVISVNGALIKLN